MKKLILLTAALAFCFIGFSQDITVRSINVQKQIKLNGKDATNAISTGSTTLTYAATQTINFRSTKLQKITLGGAITFASSNLVAGNEVIIHIIGHATNSQNYTFPAGWKFACTKPTALAATKNAILVLRSYGTTDANVLAFYSVEP